MKRLVCMILSLALCLSLSVPALAVSAAMFVIKDKVFHYRKA